MIIKILLLLAFGYLLGSIPFGLIFVHLAGKGDVRKVGSGNIGSTNVGRAAGKFWAILTFLFDAAKGAIAFLTTIFVLGGEHQTIALVVGAMAVVGHNFPIWLKFMGGKGIATSFGLYLVYNPYIGLLCMIVWILSAYAKKMSSFASIMALGFAPIFAILFGDIQAAIVMIFLSILSIIRHKDNIKRIKDGTETKISWL